jgi:dipeptidyl-peptidase-4
MWWWYEIVRGDRFQKSHTYKTLGVNEARDVVKVISWLKQQCYVDADRVALWGWSYGGYLTSMVVGEGNSGLKSAIAVAPVADWRLHLFSHPI